MPHHVLLLQLKLPKNAQNHPEVFYLIQFGFVNPINQANQSVSRDGYMSFFFTVQFVWCNATKKKGFCWHACTVQGTVHVQVFSARCYQKEETKKQSTNA